MCENYNVITEICESSQNADSSMRIFCLFYNFQLKKPTVQLPTWPPEKCSYSAVKHESERMWKVVNVSLKLFLSIEADW